MAGRQEIEQIPIAIVGMACRLPGADDLDAYWELLIKGRSAVAELPPDRLDQDLYYDSRVGVLGKTYSKLGAIISDREFHGDTCPISRELEQGVDSTHLLMCEVAAAALRNTMLDPFDLPDALKHTGVYIGHAQGSNLAGDCTYSTCIEEAAEFLRESEAFRELEPKAQDGVIHELIRDVRGRMPIRSADTPDVAASMVAGTVSKAFHLTGPFLAINSACASSLQAMLLGARALQSGNIDMAIVGGASDCKSDSLVLFSYARAVSATGSRPFDSQADGLICAEGYAALVMKTLPRAIADGDRIHAVVRGLGVSSDGKGKSLWAPRKEGQLTAMKRAYRSGVDIASLQYLEAHSTATQVGDATELNTLFEILSKHFPAGKKIPVTSVKANIGHSLETAGIASVIKTILCMQLGKIPPAINIQKLNPKIDWAKAPFYIPQAPVPWPERENSLPRRAGVNAFGIGGLNMHVVLEEYDEGLTHSLTVPTLDQTAPQQRHTDDDEAIAVIGTGCVLPGAANVDEYWDLLASGRDPKRPIPDDRGGRFLRSLHRDQARNDQLPSGGFICDFEFDWRRHMVPPKQVAQADPLQFMLLEAADQALADAGYDKRPFDRKRATVVVGTEFGGDFSIQLQMGLRLPEMQKVIQRSLRQRGIPDSKVELVCQQFTDTLLTSWPALVDETGSFSTSSLASRIGKTWNLMGGAAAIDAGEASALAAIRVGLDLLRGGDCDMAICAAGQRRMGLPEFESLSLAGVLTEHNDPASTLDKNGQGFVPGEGVGVLLLKRLSDARRDGDPIHAVIRGIGIAHQASLAEAHQLAMTRSADEARRGPHQISFLELDALTRDQTDKQIQAIAEWRPPTARQRPLLIGSPTSQIGFTHGASGMAAILKAVLQARHGCVPAAFGVQNPIANGKSTTNRVVVASRPTQLAAHELGQDQIAGVMSTSRSATYCALLEFPDTETQHLPDTQETDMATPSLESAANHATNPTTAQPNLEAFLINFVVEQTGYPADVVELDADLEADLGIDSIKKAQLFGELQEYFDVTPDENLTLDDFPTLRHVVDYLAREQSETNDISPESPRSSELSTEQANRDPLHETLEKPPTPTEVTPNRNDPAPFVGAASTPSRADAGPSCIFRFTASSVDELRQDLQRHLSTASGFDTHRLRPFAPSDRVRLAVVARKVAELNDRLRRFLDHPVGEPSSVLEQQGVYLRETVESAAPRVAFVFPGQGSQYEGMLRPLVEESTYASQARNTADIILDRLGLESFSKLAWETPTQLGRDTWSTQAAMMVANSITLAALQADGIQADLVAGHSYGELCALLAAGAWDLETALRLTRTRCEAIDTNQSTQGGLTAVGATPDQIRHLIAESGLDVYLATHNAPHQTVVGGTTAALDQFSTLLKERRIHCQRLPVPSPFHTPLLHAAAEAWAGDLATAEIHAPRIPTYSVVTNQCVFGAHQVRANLIAHLTTPVRYVELIRQIAAEQPTVFVEVGPHQHLTRLHRQILNGQQVNVVACDNRRIGARTNCFTFEPCWNAVAPSAVISSRIRKPKRRRALSILMQPGAGGKRCVARQPQILRTDAFRMTRKSIHVSQWLPCRNRRQ